MLSNQCDEEILGAPTTGKDEPGGISMEGVRAAYTALYKESQVRIAQLWGPAEPYVTPLEETAPWFQRMYFGWVYDTINRAAAEKLTKGCLPPPTLDVRSHECGLKLSRALQASLYRRNAWSMLLGADVTSTLDPKSRGVLKWVGVPQQGGYTRMMAAVEWSHAPAVRVAAHDESPTTSRFFTDGAVHGQHLFTPNPPCKATLEETFEVSISDARDGFPPTPKRTGLFSLLLATLPKYFVIQCPFLLVSTLCTVFMPVLLKEYVSYLSLEKPTWGHGLGLTFAMFLTQAGQSFCLQRYNYLSLKNGLQYRTAVNAVIFEKLFTISGKALSNPEMNTGRIINMVSTDVERIYFFLMFCMLMWSSPLLLIISIVMLANLVGWTALLAVAACAAAMPLTAYYTNKQMTARRLLSGATDARVKATNEFFSGIRITKFMTWEPRFIANIEEKRALELYYLRVIQYSRVMASFVNSATPMVMIAIVFILYFATGHELSPTVVFPSISLLAILRGPFQLIPLVFTMSVQFLISVRRITAFLECENSSFVSVDDIERYYNSSSHHSAVCHAAAILEHTDITAFVPVKLPKAPKIKMSMFAKAARRFCCEACRPASNKPPPMALAVCDDAEMPETPVTRTRSKSSRTVPPPLAEDAFELEPKLLLRDVNVSVPTGKLTVVLGATGCGKSTLLQSLLAQFEVSHGRIWVSKSIAYVPQQPWIMNATVRNNILFFDDEDATRLTEAIRVSQLEMDLELLGSGLETEIGEKGANLSGGQAARVSLARAVYADRDLYLLDDPLSALDAHVGQRVVTDCILGRLAGKTRVLATHQLHVVPKSDYVIVLADAGVAYSGCREDFMRTDLYRSMADAASHTDDERTATTAADVNEEKGTVEPAEAKGDIAETNNNTDAAAHLMSEEEKATGGVPLATYIKYFQYCGGKFLAVGIMGLYTATELLTISSSVWLSMWSTGRFDLEVKTYLSLYIVLVLLGTISSPLRNWSMYTIMRHGCATIHKAILRVMATGTMGFFDTTPHGRIMNRFSRDIDQIDNGLQMSLITGIECFFSISSSMLITMVTQPFIIIVLVPCGYIYYRIMVFFNAANREIRRTSSVMKTPVYTLLAELLTGSATITAYNRGSIVMNEALRRLDVVYSCGQLENVANRWLAVRVEFLSAVIVASIALFGVISSNTQLGVHDLGLISLSLTMAMQTTAQLNWLVRMTATVEADMNSVERLQYYIDKVEREDMPELDGELDKLQKRSGGDHSIPAESVAIEAVSPTDITPQVVHAGSLEFRNVQMRYREGLPLVLRDVSFRIQPRQKVGIVGRTGSGKSTLLLTFMRMVDICGGDIIVNDRPIRSLGLRELRRQFSMIPQAPVLFDGTVRLNVDPFLEASSEEVWQALELVGLRERIASEPEGIDGRVLEGGSNFSVGQRQLLCMARALLKKGSGFILMDEATANIDQSLDRYIQTTVMSAFSEYTVITIAHRLQTVATYDMIIVMDHGVVAEMGSPSDLVNDCNSVFRGMVDAMGPSARDNFVLSMEPKSLNVTMTGKDG